MARGWLKDVLILGLALGLFLALALYQLDLPGLYYDEAADAVPAMQLLLGQPTSPVRGAAVALGDRTAPLMVMDYVGSINTWLLLPFFALGGVNVISMRLMPVLAAVATLMLTYFLGREMFSRRAAAATALLLSVQPSFVFFSRQGIHVTSVMSLLAVGSIYSLWRWHAKGQVGYLYLAAFLLGVGLSAKILFLWFIAALGFGYVILRFVSRGRPISWPQRLGILLAFGLGASPFILYNVETQGTLQVLAANLVRSQSGVNNLDVGGNLLTRLDNLRVLLEGSFFWFLGGIFAAPVYPYVFGVATTVGLAMAWITRDPSRLRLLLIAGLVIVVLVQSAVTLSGLWATHLYALLPFLALLLGASLDVLARPAKWAGVVVAVVATALVGVSLQVDWRYHEALSESGGLANHSDAIYRLANFIDDRREPVVAMDWGLVTNLQLITRGRVNPNEVFGYDQEPDAGFPDRLYPYLVNAPHLFVFHTPGFTVYPRFAAFSELVARLGKRAVVERTFAQRDGTPLFLVYRIEN